MASYIQGETDYIPALQPFQPDYNFLGNVLQTRQSRYDSSHKQLNKLYGTLLYSPMLRTDNNKDRDTFFQTIDQDIKKMSGLDLSLQENTDAANNVFKSMYDNKGIIKDMTWTKQYQTQLDTADNYKNCIDPDKCGGGYWNEGVEALNWKAKEFMNASPEDALNFANAEYTPYINVMDKAIKAAKDSGFEVKYDQLSGGYNVTTKNGEKLIAPLASYFTSKFGSDPAVMNYYKTFAYTKRKRWVAENSEKFGGDDAATQEYINMLTSETHDHINGKKKNADQQHDDIKKRKDNYEAVANRDGVLKTDIHTIATFNELQSSESIAASNKDYFNNAQNTSKNVVQNLKNIKGVVDNFDSMVGLAMASSEFENIASIYAMGTKSQTKTADPFAVQAQGHKNALELAALKEGYVTTDEAGNKQWNPGTDYYNEQAKSQFKAAEDKKKREIITGIAGSAGGAASSSGGDKPIFVAAKTGAATGNVISSLEENRVELNKLAVGDKGKKLEVITNVLNGAYSYSTTAAKNGIVPSNIAEQSIKQIFISAGYKPADAAAKTLKFLKGGADQAAILTELGTLDIKQLNKVYDRSVSVINPNSNDEWSLSNKDWSSSAWAQTKESRMGISANTDAYNDMHAQFAKDLTKVSTNLKAKYTAAAKVGNTPTETFALQLLRNSEAGLVPKDDPKWKQEQAAIWGKANASKFQTGITTKQIDFSPVSPLEVKGGPKTGRYQQVMISQQDMATQWALTHYDKIVGDINTQYTTDVQAWNHDFSEGKTSTGKKTMAFTMTSDVADISLNGTLNEAAFFRTYKAEEGSDGMLIVTGDAGQDVKTLKNDVGAKQIFDQYISDFNSSLGDITDGRPVSNWNFQRIAGYDKDKWAFTVTPSESWLKKYRQGDDHNVFGSVKFNAGQSITVFMPKDKISQDMKPLFDATDYSYYDYKLDHGSLPVDNPKAGHIDIVSANNMYTITGFVNKYDPITNSIIPVTIPPRMLSTDQLEGKAVYDHYATFLDSIENQINEDQGLARSQNGSKDINSLTQ